MPRSRFDDDDDEDDRPRRRRRRDDDDHDPFRPRKKRGGGPPIGLLVGGAVGLALLVVGGIVMAVTMRGPREDAKAKPAAPAAQDVPPAPVVPPAKVEPPKPAHGVPMPAGTDGVRQVAFGGTDVVAFMGSAGLTADQLLTVANVKTGALVGRVTLPNGESVNGIAVAPGGRFAAVHVSAPGSGDVVVLHELATKQAYRFTPYSRKGAITNPDLMFVGFVGPDRLLTAHENSGFDVWQLPKMERVCGQPGRPRDAMPRLERNGFAMRCTNAALSPDGKTFAVLDGAPKSHGFAFYDTATAERKAQTPPFIQGLSANFWGAAFTPDGKRFAAMTSYFAPQSVTSLQVWDAASGKRLSEAPVAGGKTGTAMAFWGPDLVILSQGGFGSVDVMAAATGEVVATARAMTSGSSQMIAPDTPGGALWYVFDNKIIRNESATLGSVPPPGATLPGRSLDLTRDGPQWK